MQRKLIVDAQVFQTPAKDRGMGKYSLELLSYLEQLALKKKWSSTELLFSNKLENEQAIKKEIKKKIKNAKFTSLPLLPNTPGNSKIPTTNRKIIDRHIALIDEKTHIDFLILSLMQGETYPVFPSQFRSNINRMVLFYDVVPLMFFTMYLENPITRVEYLSKISELLIADKYLTISKTVANDLINYLGIDKNRIVNIDGGPADLSDAKKKVDIPRPFIIMPTGNDLRKNNERAVRGFEEFNKRNGGKYKLVITSFFKDFQIEELSSLAKNLIFTGNIQGSELNYLYSECEALLFPSEYEGLGMPILEVLKFNKPIACSNISVFREISPTSFAYFDPYSIAEIAVTLERVTKDYVVDTKEYENIISKYSWSKTATNVVEAADKRVVSYNILKPRVAVFCPDPAKNNLAGRVAQESYAEMSRLMEPEFFISDCYTKNEQRVNYLKYIQTAHSIARGLGYNESAYNDNIIYNIDNSRESAEIVFFALSHPGICIFYELPNENVWQSMVDKGLINRARFKIEKALHRKINPQDESMIATLLATQKKIIVFDSEMQKTISQVASIIGSNVKIHNLKMPIPVLLYDEVMPEKTITVQNLQDSLFNDPYVTDFYWKEELSKTKVLVVGDEDDYLLIMDAMKYGTVPVIDKKIAEKYDLPVEVYLALDDNGSALEKAFSLVDDKKTFESMSYAARLYAQNQKTYKAFAESVYSCLREYNSKTNNNKHTI
jgi:glycosyltransferase involved in cell wall biosynthesis